MRKKIFLILTICLIYFQQSSSAKALDGIAKFPLNNNTTISLEIADTDEEKTRGLMGRQNLPEKRGMIFIFKPERKVTFWMKDTLISLDMIFINKGKVVKIVKNALPNQTIVLYSSDTEVSEVIEVNGGFADKYMIVVGSNVVYENINDIEPSEKSSLMIVAK